jgi:DNA-directed RNA polymerase specialized sigma24 family protein
MALDATANVANGVDHAAARSASDAGAIASLRPRDRQILRLVYWDQVSMAELAEYLDCSIAEAGRRLDRAFRHAERRLRRVVPRPAPPEVPAPQPDADLMVP